MDKEKYLMKRVASIRVEPYLAEYARKKFEIDGKTGGIKIPDTFDLYHCVWQVMSRRPKDTQPMGDENLTIWLPCRRALDGMPGKHPEYWNYISPRGVHLVEKQLRRLFNWEFHHYCEDQVARGVMKVDAVRSFIRFYGLGLDCEDALLKNLQRHERTISVFLGIKKQKSRKKRNI